MKVVSVVTTPNPDALKFTVDQDLLKEGSRSFTSVAGAEKDTLAAAIFALSGVTSVFYMANFVTVNKKYVKRIQRPGVISLRRIEKQS